MNIEDLEKLLKSNGLRKTKARIHILKTIQTTTWALSHKELEENAPKDIDRVTIYRTLNSFEEKGLIHKILDEEGTSHFAMCNHTCSHHNHADNHVHFHCSNCKKIFCLDDFDLKGIKMPNGFTPIESNVKIGGKCASCN